MAKSGRLTSEHKHILRSSGWLSTRSLAFQELLLEIGCVKSLGAGQLLYARGKVPTHVHGLIKGQIDVQILAPNGEELSYPSGQQSKWYSFADVITREPAVGTAIARQPTLLLSISRSKFLEFLNEDPRRYAEVIAHDNALRRNIQAVLSEVVTGSGIDLVWSHLAWIARNDRLDANNSIAISQSDFASSVGVSLPSVQRAFRDMKRRGIIDTYYGKIVVKNLHKLQEIAVTLKSE